jgi:hypothetical protein
MVLCALSLISLLHVSARILALPEATVMKLVLISYGERDEEGNENEVAIAFKRPWRAKRPLTFNSNFNLEPHSSNCAHEMLSLLRTL